MLTDLKASAQRGLLLGVEYGIALVVVGMLVTYALGDYWTVRQMAQNGQRAYVFLSKQGAK